MNKLITAKNAIHLLLLITLSLCSFVSNASIIFINEIHYDNNGADKNEFVEIAGTANVNLMDWSLLFYNGSNGEVYKTVTIGDVSLDDTNNGFGFHAFNTPGIQNGSSGGIGDGIALIDNYNQLRQFLSYEGTFKATNGIAQGMFSESINITQNSTPVGMSLQLSGTGKDYQDFTWELANESFGSSNTSQQFPEKQILPMVQVTEPNLTMLFFLLVPSMLLLNKRTRLL
jgi:hypothetical protein